MSEPTPEEVRALLEQYKDPSKQKAVLRDLYIKHRLPLGEAKALMDEVLEASKALEAGSHRDVGEEALFNDVLKELEVFDLTTSEIFRRLKSSGFRSTSPDTKAGVLHAFAALRHLCLSASEGINPTAVIRRVFSLSTGLSHIITQEEPWQSIVAEISAVSDDDAFNASKEAYKL